MRTPNTRYVIGLIIELPVKPDETPQDAFETFMTRMQVTTLEPGRDPSVDREVKHEVLTAISPHVVAPSEIADPDFDADLRYHGSPLRDVGWDEDNSTLEPLRL